MRTYVFRVHRGTLAHATELPHPRDHARDHDPDNGHVTLSRMTFAGAAVLCASWIAMNAAAKRAPTPVERKAVVAAVNQVQGQQLPVRVKQVVVSTVDSRYASIRWSEGPPSFEVTEILHRGTHGWAILWGHRRNEPSDGVCAFAPRAVVLELYAVPCPPWAALHGRGATPGEKAQLVGAFRGSALTRDYQRSGRVTRSCVSRIDPRFAASAIDLTSTGAIVWFRRGPWRVVFETVSSRGTRPSPRVVLSLASCVGYNAAQYGG